jgi:hypothetical protein
MDLARAIEEAKSLPDEALKREISSPSGMMPGFLAMSELSDRQAVRTSGGQKKRQSMAQEMLGRGFAQGGVVSATNPFLSYLEQRTGQSILGIADDPRGLTPLAQPEAPMQLQRPDPLMAPPMPNRPTHFEQGGLVSLLRR